MEIKEKLAAKDEQGFKEIRPSDLVLIQHDPNSNLTKIPSRQTFR